ncbi:hypothetical protein NE237_024210 [Protea cynaroides]|uniref:DUF4005 domain-containing protein n=1 Tax=Protea cynaroides TaxID=273540 RepID=A0A9Q0HFG2_9MAGN|nr:hypothetical protein NE237_024210 [Protea cynaroides]
MVRSSSSCFKVFACGNDSMDIDDLQTKSKESTDKRGWSFRKRSASHRVLSNSVISETPSTGNKEAPASTTISSDPQPNLTAPEKVSVPSWTNEKPELSTALHSGETNSPIATQDACKIEPNLEESVAIVIQATIRGYMARRTFLKLKNVVKLQAAVRGHLVRRQAMGTLRCVQAIVKVQALVRARRARLLVGGSSNEKTEQTAMPLGKEDLGTKPNQTYSSTMKLLNNGFARQLLESAPKTKSIHIKCDTSKSNSSWNWLERWMSVSSSELTHTDKPECPENQDHRENIKAIAAEAEFAPPAEVASVIADLNSNSSETVAGIESEKSLITCDSNDFDFQAGHQNCSSKIDDLDQPHIEEVDLDKAQNVDNSGFQDSHTNCPSIKGDHDQPQVDVGLGKLQEAYSTRDLHLNQTDIQSSVISQTVLNSVSQKPELGEQPVCTMKSVASEQLETESKKTVSGSRKASNPAFIAVQSKFEDLSSSATSSCRSVSSINQDLGTESKLDNLPCPEDYIVKTEELSLTENSISHNQKVQVGGSEYGTKLSFSSTLDSPDISEVGRGKLDHEAKVAEKWADDVNNGAVHELGVPGLEAKNISNKPPPYLSHDASDQPGKTGDVNGESCDPVAAVDSSTVEWQPVRSVSDAQIQMDSIIDQQTWKSSPEGSPKSHMTAPESHGTPSSQVSIKVKRDKLNGSGSNENRRSQKTSKRKPPSNKHDSGASSTEQLPKDSKNGKWHNTFGSARSDSIDQERRDSSSSNSLPSYMQATESVKAKAHPTHNSPRSSPDVQEKDIYIKKRHSLPSSNGKQGSPRMQRSMSQAQQGVKGTERKWQR